MDSQKNLQPINSRAAKRKISKKYLPSNHYELKKIRACISHHSLLLYLLTCRQPLSLKELLDELGTSKKTLLRDLKQLIKYRLIIRINFESHVLYVIDGDFNSLIHSTLVNHDILK